MLLPANCPVCNVFEDEEDDEPSPIDRLISLYYLRGNARGGILEDNDDEE